MALIADEEFSGFSEIEFLEDNFNGKVFNINECPVRKVTVYLDKAEVCRKLRVQVCAGENELTIRRLSHAVDTNSLRVEVKRFATICDVQFYNRQLDEEKLEHDSTQATLNAALSNSRRHNESLLKRLGRLCKQRSVLESFADTLNINGAIHPKQESCTSPIGFMDIYDPKRMETISGFFELYEKQASRLDESILQLKGEIKTSECCIKEMENKLKALEEQYHTMLSRDLVILLESAATTQLDLTISYVVSHVSWIPKYDVRVFSNDNVLKLHYFGLIRQSTGENWENAKIILSTSQPAIGGTCPNLGLQKLHFSAALRSECVLLRRNKISRTRRAVKALSFHAFNERMDRIAAQCAALNEKGQPPTSMITELPAKVSTATSNNNIIGGTVINEEKEMKIIRPTQGLDEPFTSTQFEVPRLYSIACDDEYHKVTIGIIDLQPTFKYETVPKKSPFAYLTASMCNTSAFALLPGNTNIFVNNNFISKGELNAVAPQEDFQCDLGVDEAVKVAYRPMYKTKTASSGGGKVNNVTFRQTIELKNSHAKAIRILIIDQLPLSIEDKLKVTLLEPIIKHPEKYDANKPIRLNKTNHVEWELDLQAGEAREVILKYSIEYPIGELVGTSIFDV